jgi:hypothetical protein
VEDLGMTEWFAANWQWLAGVLLTNAFWMFRTRNTDASLVRFGSRYSNLERAVLGMVYAHDDHSAHDAFIKEDRRNRPAAPVDMMPQARQEAERFRDGVL